MILAWRTGLAPLVLGTKVLALARGAGLFRAAALAIASCRSRLLALGASRARTWAPTVGAIRPIAMRALSGRTGTLVLARGIRAPILAGGLISHFRVHQGRKLGRHVI